MTAYPSIYRAKTVRIERNSVQAYVPQVFGDTLIAIVNFVGSPPTTVGMGWVAFQAGNPEFPVWFGVAETTTDGDGLGPGMQRLWDWGGESAPPLTLGFAATDDVPSQSSELYINKYDVTGTIDWSNQISLLAADDTIYLQYAVDSSSWHRYTVTGPASLAGDTWTVPVTTADGSAPGTAPDVGSKILVSFTVVAENQGPPGPPGPPGPTGPPGSSFRALVGGATAVTVNHNLGSQDVNVEVYRATPPYDRIDCTVEHTSANSVTLRFLTAPAVNEYVANVILGSPGAAGGGGGTFAYVQATPAQVWVVVHNLGFNPNVTIVDSAGDEVVGEVQYDNVNQVTLSFAAPFAGTAYLS